MRILRRLRYWFRNRGRHGDLREELALHRELRARDFERQGLSPNEAATAARRSMGNETYVREEARGVWLPFDVDAAMNDVRYALRVLGRARLFTIATTTTIALGIGCGCAVFALVNTVLLRPLPYPHSDRLVGLWNEMPGLGIKIAKQSPGTYAFFNENATSLEQNGVYLIQPMTLSYAESNVAPERVRVALFTASMFNVLGTRPLLGRLLSESDGMHGEPPVAVISERLWRSRFGGERSVIGRHIGANGKQVEIVGVLPKSFAFPDVETRLWLTMDISSPQYVDGFAFAGVARLKPGATVASTQRELEKLITRLPQRFPTMRSGVSTAATMRQSKFRVAVHPMRDDVVKEVDHVLWLIAGTVGLLVIVAFSNVASLLLVRIQSRQREFAVRSALGASGWGVWQSFMAEIAIVAAVGGLLGFATASAVLRLLVYVGPADLPRMDEVHVDRVVVVAAIVLTLMFALMSAAIGALRLRSKDAIRALRGGRSDTSGPGSHRLRTAFVVIQVALSLVLLAGAGVLARSVLKLRAVDPGFDPSNTFTFWTFLPASSYKRSTDVARFYDTAIDRIQRLHGVIAASATSKLPLEIEGTPYEVLVWADDAPIATNAVPPVFQATSTTTGYFKAMKIPLVAGRSFDEAGVRRGVYESVVSRGVVEQFWHDPTGTSGVGKRVRLAPDAPWYTIVGVVGDVRDSTLTEPAISEVYFPQEAPADSASQAQTKREMAFVVRARGPIGDVQRQVEDELHALDRNLPFYRPSTMHQIVTGAHSRMTFALMLLASGAGATLLLAVVGLYGVIAYGVSLRSREISIRIALGLPPAGAAMMILKQGEIIVVFGATAGVATFLVFARLLNTLAFGVSTIDVGSLAMAMSAVLVVASVATWIPARRAARFDPALALKGD